MESMEAGSQALRSLKRKQQEPMTKPEKMLMLMASDVEGAAPLEVEGGAKSG